MKIKALEEKITEGASAGKTEKIEEYEEGKWYYAGDKVTEGGVVYICTAPDGMPSTWSPSLYPPYWSKITED